MKLYRALAPVRVLRVPIPVRGHTAGVLTLAIAESRREISPAQVEVAEELAGRATLAIENAMLHREAAETDRRFQALFAAHPQPMWVFDAESLAFLSANGAAARLYGYSAEEFKQMTILDLLPQEDTNLSIAPAEHAESRVGIAYARHRRKDGSIVEMELASQPFELDGRPGSSGSRHRRERAHPRAGIASPDGGAAPASAADGRHGQNRHRRGPRLQQRLDQYPGPRRSAPPRSRDARSFEGQRRAHSGGDRAWSPAYAGSSSPSAAASH